MQSLQYRWLCVCSFGPEFSAVFSSIGAKCTSHQVVVVGWQIHTVVLSVSRVFGCISVPYQDSVSYRLAGRFIY